MRVLGKRAYTAQVPLGVFAPGTPVLVRLCKIHLPLFVAKKSRVPKSKGDPGEFGVCA